jgi:hypothetical protein
MPIVGSMLASELSCEHCGCIPEVPTCGNIWFDDFLTEESGYTNTPSNAHFDTGTGGRLRLFYPGGTAEVGYGARTRLIDRPALNGLKLYVESQGGSYSVAYDPFAASPGKSTNIQFGEQGSSLFVSLIESDSDTIYLFFTDENGDLQQRLIGTVSAVLHGAGGNILRLEIHDTSAGAGTYDILCFVNHTLLYVECDVPLTIPSQVEVGVSGNNSYWDYLCVGSDTENRPRYWENAPTFYRFSIPREDTTFECYYRLPRDFENGAFTGNITIRKKTGGAINPGSELTYSWYWYQSGTPYIWPFLAIDPITGGYDLTLTLQDDATDEVEIYEGTVMGALSFSTPTTLTRNSGTSTGTCFSSVATIDIQPVECAVQQVEATPCGEPLTGPNEILWLDYSIDGVAGRACLGWQFNVETGVFEYTGYSEASVACVGDYVLFRIYCNPISDETGEPEWRIAIYGGATGTGSGQPVDDFPMEYVGTGAGAPLTVSGTLTEVCTSIPFSGDTSICSDPPFFRCCPDNLGMLCCGNTLTATGSFLSGTCGCDPHSEAMANTSGELLCGGSPQSITGFDYNETYWISDFPFDGTFSYIGWKLLVYCSTDGTVRWAALDGTGCFVEGGEVEWDCSTYSGTTGNIYGTLLLGCCMDDITDGAVITLSQTAP